MEGELTPLRILVLETDDYDAKRAAGPEDTIILGTVIGHNRGYRVPLETMELTTRLTRELQVDLVILGNNETAGITLARCIDKAMWSRTIVAWNDYWPGKEAGYLPAQTGIRFFCSRSDLKTYLPQVREQLEREAEEVAANRAGD